MDRNVVLLLGSNIQPEDNITRAVQMIKRKYPILSMSSVWVTHPEGGGGEDYHNLAVEIQTDQSIDNLKNHTLRGIETKLGRIRSDDKNAPRTMDIDIILDNDQILDEKLWMYGFIAIPVSQIRPKLSNPVDGETLQGFAQKQKRTSWTIELPAYPFIN